MAAKKKAAAAKKPAAKKAPAKAAAKKAAPKAAPAPRKLKAVSEPMSKTQITATIAETTGLTKKQVTAVFEELSTLVEAHVAKKGAGQFTLPGLLKITTVKKPATKARKGINPFTGEETVFKAKPASIVVKVRPLKKLKDMAAS
ncbi:DNA-binding protein [Alcanivorax sp. S71-1-4]|uniref:HU family DNA-binding protein n=1 Tax=Alcanivorax sp. S71-1-4 TaxID=1177159 RepID=UPI0013586126|nr:HU family DNA-binding protein [Alcanivorax sp. S71-1-4]KAF0810240.1 DNA-binding protein [Alcanivorax sp. S71-1-4]